MSLSIDGVWKAGVWAETTWGEGVWREGDAIPIVVFLASCSSSITLSNEQNINITDNSDITLSETAEISGC